MRKVQETKLSEVFVRHLALLSHEEVKDKPLQFYKQHASAILKRLDVTGKISLKTSIRVFKHSFD
jgi:methylglyoxal synthase